MQAAVKRVRVFIVVRTPQQERAFLTEKRNRHVRFTPDFVARLFTALQGRNNRIRLNASLNQYCVSAFVLESILLVWVVKIVLQHNHSESGH